MYGIKLKIPEICSECKYCKVKYFNQPYCELLEDFTNSKSFKLTSDCPIYKQVLELNGK